MFFIIGNKSDNKLREWRVIDTEDRVTTDISEGELLELISKGIVIENALEKNGKLVGKVFDLDRYGYIGKENTYTIVSIDGDNYTIVDQNGVVKVLDSKEMIRLATQYSVTNATLKCIRMPQGYREVIETAKDLIIELGKVKVYLNTEDNIVVEGKITVDNLGEYFISFDYANLDYSLLLRRCANTYGDYLYYFGFLETYDLYGDLWGILEGENIGTSPHVAVVIEYNKKKDKFTKAVVIVNANRQELRNLQLRERGKFKIKCEAYDSSELTSSWGIVEVDFVKNKITTIEQKD